MENIVLEMLLLQMNSVEVSKHHSYLYLFLIDYIIDIQDHTVLFYASDNSFNVTFDIMASKIIFKLILRPLLCSIAQRSP